MDLGFDVLFATIDSLRLDVAQATPAPGLASVGRLRRAETPATFTLPAHWSFFCGFLPRVVDDLGPLIDGRSRVWRPASARPDVGQPLIEFSARTVIEDFAERGYETFGLGGVQFFDPIGWGGFAELFQTFAYHGQRSGQPIDLRRRSTCDGLDVLIASIRSAPRFFAFVNFSETHFPYVDASSVIDPGTRQMLELVAVKHVTKSTEPSPSIEVRSRLLSLQSLALAKVDRAFVALLEVVRARPRSCLIVACSDHGEAFGEQGNYGHGISHPQVWPVPLWVGWSHR